MTFLRNLADQVYEVCRKIGDPDSDLTLNYPVPSLCRLFGCTPEGLEEAERAFAGENPWLRDVRFGRFDERTRTVTLSASAVRALCDTVPPDPVLEKLIALCGRPGVGEEEVVAAFRACGKEPFRLVGDGEEFDLCLWTEGSYRYCFTFSFGTVSYHRLTEEDYAEIFG